MTYSCEYARPWNSEEIWKAADAAPPCCKLATVPDIQTRDSVQCSQSYSERSPLDIDSLMAGVGAAVADDDE